MATSQSHNSLQKWLASPICSVSSIQLLISDHTWSCLAGVVSEWSISAETGLIFLIGPASGVINLTYTTVLVSFPYHPGMRPGNWTINLTGFWLQTSSKFGKHRAEFNYVRKLQHHEMKKQWKLVLHTQVRTACVQQLSSNDILRILNQKQKVFQVILTSEHGHRIQSTHQALRIIWERDRCTQRLHLGQQ